MTSVTIMLCITAGVLGLVLGFILGFCEGREEGVVEGYMDGRMAGYEEERRLEAEEVAEVPLSRPQHRHC